jgi:hypothetical protein
MVELGSFWAYYTLWYLTEVPGAGAVCIEPDPNHMRIGKCNAEMNGMADRIDFVDGCIGGTTATQISHMCASSGTERKLPCFSMANIVQLGGGSIIELLHIDAQEVELEFMGSMEQAVHNGQVRFVIVSTHHRTISGSLTTHEDCLLAIKELGGHVLVEQSIRESFSGDGLIAASFLVQDRGLTLPAISRNKATNSMFPRP